jgi:DNA-binding transcriptional ArsR family regulator
MTPATAPLSHREGLDTLDVLSNPARLTIFQWLLRQEPRFVPMSEIAEQLGFRRSSLSPHLSALVRARLICAVGQGEDHRYRACVSSIDRLSAFLTAECCEGHADRCVLEFDAAAPCDQAPNSLSLSDPPRQRVTVMSRDAISNVDSTTPERHPLLADVANQATSWGSALAERAAHAGLAVTQPDGTLRSIPIGALPIILSDDEITRRAKLAADLVAATTKASRWRMAGARRGAVLSALGPTEQRLVQATWNGPSHLAVARVDFLGSPELYALEVNATIPAMQGYSDIAAEAWLATVAAGRSDLPALVAANGSNAIALLNALVDLYAQERSGELANMGLLCRRGDAQFTELRYLRERFRGMGVQAHIVHPDELTWQRGYLVYRGEPLQLLYRHLFLSRLDAEPMPDLESAIAERTRHGTLVLNRPAPHLEMKSTLALLSHTVDSPELSQAMELTDAERQAVRIAVPWTRSLTARSSIDGLDDAALADVRAQPEAYVLKRSWSYGGNEVFVGRAHDTGAFWSRVHATYPDVDRWADLIDRAAGDLRGGGFVVQRAVPRTLTEQMLCTPTTVQRAAVVTDYSAYASVGTMPGWSGVCRAATSDVVNIVGGGAVVPIIRRHVADRLLPSP